MRVLAVWAVLFAAYAATLGSTRSARSDFAGDEPRHLLAAESIVSDRDIDLADEFATRAYAGVPPRPAAAGRGAIVLGRAARAAGLRLRAADRARLRARRGAGGRAVPRRDRGARVRARRAGRTADRAGAVGERRGAARRALPARARALDRVYPDADGGRDARGRRAGGAARARAAGLGSAVAGAALLALLPWLGPKYLLPAAPVAVALVRWTARRGRRTAALAAAEIMVASLVVYATLNDRLYGGLMPSAVAASGDAADRRELARRLPRADPAAGGAVDRPRRRPAALGAGARASASSRPGCCGARAAPTSRA